MIDESIPPTEEIEWALRFLWRHRLEGPSGMQAEHLQYWLVVATCEEWLDTAKWERVAEIIHMEFRDCSLLTDFMWQMVVLIPKGNGDFRGIGIVDMS